MARGTRRGLDITSAREFKRIRADTTGAYNNRPPEPRSLINNLYTNTRAYVRGVCISVFSLGCADRLPVAYMFRCHFNSYTRNIFYHRISIRITETVRCNLIDIFRRRSPPTAAPFVQATPFYTPHFNYFRPRKREGSDNKNRVGTTNDPGRDVQINISSVQL